MYLPIWLQGHKAEICEIYAETKSEAEQELPCNRIKVVSILSDITNSIEGSQHDKFNNFQYVRFASIITQGNDQTQSIL